MNFKKKYLIYLGLVILFIFIIGCIWTWKFQNERKKEDSEDYIAKTEVWKYVQKEVTREFSRVYEFSDDVDLEYIGNHYWIAKGSLKWMDWNDEIFGGKYLIILKVDKEDFYDVFGVQVSYS